MQCCEVDCFTLIVIMSHYSIRLSSLFMRKCRWCKSLQKSAKSWCNGLQESQQFEGQILVAREAEGNQTGGASHVVDHYEPVAGECNWVQHCGRWIAPASSLRGARCYSSLTLLPSDVRCLCMLTLQESTPGTLAKRKLTCADCMSKHYTECKTSSGAKWIFRPCTSTAM